MRAALRASASEISDELVQRSACTQGALVLPSALRHMDGAVQLGRYTSGRAWLGGIARMLRNLAGELRSTPHTLILSCGQWTPPADLDEALTLLDLPLPREEELRILLSNIARACGSALEEEVLEELTHACSGLSEARVRHVAARALALGRFDLLCSASRVRRGLRRRPSSPRRPCSRLVIPRRSTNRVVAESQSSFLNGHRSTGCTAVHPAQS